MQTNQPSQSSKGLSPADNRKVLVHTSVALVVYVLFQFIFPPFDPITRGGMGVLGIFLATMYLLFTNEGAAWPSFMAVGLIGMTNVAPASAITQQSWGNVMIPFVCACLLLNYAMSETGLIYRFAIWFITRKFLKNRPWTLLFMFFFSLQLLGLVCTSSPITVMYMSISEGIFETIGCKEKGDKFTSSVMMAVGWVAQGAQAMTPISHTMITMIFGFILHDFGVSISIAKFSLIFLAWGLVYFAGIWLVFRFVLKPDVSKLANFDIDAVRAKLPPMGRRERMVGIVSIVLILFWISPDLLALIPALAGVASYVLKMGQTIPALVAVGLLCALRADGVPVLDIKVGSSKIMWGTVYMMAALMCFGYVFDLESVGITMWMRGIIAPLTANLSATAFVAAVIAFMLIATNFLSNAVCVMLYTVIVPMAGLIPGVNPLVIGLIIASTANADSLLTPASCPVSGLLAGSGWVKPSFMLKYSWILMVVAFLGYFFVGYPLATRIYG